MILYRVNVLCLFVILCCCSKEPVKPKKNNPISSHFSQVYFDNNSPNQLTATMDGKSFGISPWSYKTRKLVPGSYEISFDKGKKYYELEVEHPKTYVLDPFKAGRYYTYRVYYSRKGTGGVDPSTKVYSKQYSHAFTVHFLLGQNVPSISFKHQGERFVLRKLLPKPLPWGLVVKLLKDLDNKKLNYVYAGWQYEVLVAACSKDISYAREYLFPRLRLYQGNTRTQIQKISPKIFAKCATSQWIEEILPKLSKPRKSALAMDIYKTILKLAHPKELEQIFPYFTKSEKERLLYKITYRPLEETQNLLILALKEPKHARKAIDILKKQKDLSKYPQLLENLDKLLLSSHQDPSQAYMFIDLAYLRVEQVVKNPQLLATVDKLLANKQYNHKKLLTIKLKADKEQTNPILVKQVAHLFRSRHHKREATNLIAFIESEEIFRELAKIFPFFRYKNEMLDIFIATKRDIRGAPLLIAAAKDREYYIKEKALKHMAQLPWLKQKDCLEVLIPALRQRSIQLTDEQKQRVLDTLKEQNYSAPAEELVERWFAFLSILDSRDGIDIVIQEFSKLASADKKQVKVDLISRYEKIYRKYRPKILIFLAGGEVSFKRQLPYARLLTAKSPQLRLDSFTQLAKLAKTNGKIKSRLTRIMAKEKNPKIKRSMEYQLKRKDHRSSYSRRSMQNRFARSSRKSQSKSNYREIQLKKEELTKLAKKLPKNRSAKSKLFKYLTHAEEQIANHAMSLLNRHLQERDLRTLLKKYSKCPDRVRSDILYVARRYQKSNNALLILKKAASDTKENIRRSAYSQLLTLARTLARAKSILKRAIAKEENVQLKNSYQKRLKNMR